MFFFYLSYACSSLWAQRKRYLWVVIGIMVGVAAIVGVQTVGQSSQDSVVRNIKTINGGDVALSFFPSPLKTEPAALDMALAGHSSVISSTYSLWGRGGVTVPTGEQSPAIIRGIFPETYPLYGSGELIQLQGHTLGQQLAAPGSVVLSDNLANRLGLTVGEPITLSLNGAFLPATVAGVIASDGNRTWDMHIYGYVFAPYQMMADALGYDAGALSILYLRTESDADLTSLESELQEQFPEADIQTWAELEEESESDLASWTRTMSLMGLLVLILGGVGIGESVQIVIRQRITEIGILRAIGVKPRQVRYLFLIEAVGLGLSGSILGVLAGIGVSYLLVDFAGRAQNIASVQVHLYPVPLIVGCLVGTLVTVAFSYLPVSRASELEPNALLRPGDETLPVLSRWAVVRQLLVVTLGLGVAFALSLQSVWGLLLPVVVLPAFALLKFTLRFFTSRTSRWFSRRGSVPFRLVVLGIHTQADRVANTLLVLCLGISAMGIALSLATSFKQAFRESARQDVGYTILVATTNDVAPEIQSRMMANPAVEKVVPAQRGVVRLLTGREGISIPIVGLDLSGDQIPHQIVAGRDLDRQDAGLPRALLLDSLASELDIQVGDRLELQGNSGQTVQVEIVGLEKKGLAVSGVMKTSLAVMDTLGERGGTLLFIRTDDGSTQAVLDQIRSEFKRAFSVSLDELLFSVNRIIDQQVQVLWLVAMFSLVVGGGIIANNVILSLLERRREIGVMKAVGAKQRQVLGMLLLENGLVGLISGLLGISFTVLGAFFLAQLTIRAAPAYDLAHLVGLVMLGMMVSVLVTWGVALPYVRETASHVLRNE